MFTHNNSILRRYTPPTCTLNIWATPSPLSRWTNLTIVDALKFELSFDDPRLLDQDQFSLSGNHEQLEALSEVVTGYVQDFLQQKTLSSSFPLLSSNTLTLSEKSTLPSLKPNGYLFHELNLGILGRNSPHSSINLSSSQLFDLADALDSYHQDLQVIPDLYRNSQRQILFKWGSIAALLLFTVSIPLFWLPWYQVQMAKTKTDTTENQDNLAINPNLFEIKPPVPPPPPETLPKLSTPPNLANRDPLPTPPPSETLTPPPRPQTVPLVVPPNAVLPPTPVVPPAPPRQVLQITPQESLGMNQVTILPAPKKATVEPNLSVANGVNTKPELNFPKLPDLEQKSASRSLNNAPSADTRQSLVIPATPPPGLLEPIPQVTEVRQYFEKTWNPPSELKQTLEYRLLMAENGSIKQISPLGKAAVLYQPQTGMPSVGQPFVSPLSMTGEQTLRLILTPKGEVKTFLEENQTN